MAASTNSVPKLITWAPVGKTNASASPFGGKIEIALRMAGIDYTVAPGDPNDSKTFVKHKVRHALSSSVLYLLHGTHAGMVRNQTTQ
jgi:hypothetical protein